MSLHNRLLGLALRAALPADDAEAIAGDLAAESARQMAAGRWPVSIAVWQWRQVVAACAHALVSAAMRLGHVRWSLASDARFAVRSLMRHPASSAAMVLTLAVGIGANAAGFTVLDSLLFKPLPYPDADRLVVLQEFQPAKPDAAGGVSYLNFAEWRSSTRAFESMALAVPDDASLSIDGSPVGVSGLHVSPGFFRTLGVSPAIGSSFEGLDDEATLPNGAWPIMLTDRGWRLHFGSAPDVVGRSVELDGRVAEIIGVTAPNVFPVVQEPFDYWATTISLGRAADPSSANGSRNFRQYPGALARLRPGVTLESALDDLRRVHAGLATQYPRAFKEREVRIERLRDVFTEPAERLAWMLYALVTVVWLVACVNVVNMSLARASSRIREVAVRKALGASRLGIVRQFVVESLAIALIGAMAGLVIATWLLAGAVAWLPAELPAVSALTPDSRVLALALLVAVTTAIVCGGVPAWFATRAADPHLNGSDGRVLSSALSRRVRDGLIALQVALALVLLAGAGLLGNSLIRLQRERPGFDASNIWVTRLNLAGVEGPRPNLVQQATDLEAAVARVPGVSRVALAQSVPFTGLENSTQVSVPGLAPADDSSTAQLRFVTPEYFELMGIPLTQGRAPSDRDGPAAPSVALVNTAFVKAFMPSAANVVGQTISLGWGGEGPKAIVGVVGDVRHRGPGDAPRPEVYIPHAQFSNAALHLLVRTDAGVVPDAAALYQAIHTVRPDIARQPIRSLASYRDDTLSLPRFNTALLVGFAVIALALASVGLYGVTSYVTAQRTREIGVRMALGAEPGSVLRLMMTQVLRPVGLGILLGIGAALVVTRALQPWLYGVASTDLGTMAVVVAVLVIVACAASFIPAQRAARIDPTTALRTD
jgi:putative ABC transport system permease protein